jgi:enamine deaminase RidA (YjgF/YER057c/UK114 family)
MLKNYFISLPSISGTMEEEWDQCRNQILDTVKAGYRPLKLNIFTSSPDFNSFFQHKKLIGKSVIDTFGNHCPSFGITIHPPELPWKVSVEGLYARSGSAEIVTKFLGPLPYVVIGSMPESEVWAAGLGNDLYTDDTRKAAIEAFKMIAAVLNQEGMTFNNLIRQWNYIGNILELKDGYQNYQLFNEVRSEYYKKYRTTQGFPAATGIGMKLGGVFIDFYALMTSEDLTIKAVDNPNQVNAYQYGQQVLKGLITKGKSLKNPPCFERALLVANNHRRTLFISGTASIIGQETIGKGNVIEQTLVTIENINKLKDSGYIGQLIGQELSPGKCSLVRVYVRNQKDFAAVKDICSEHYPNVPSIFTESDICRDDLLVEIEAEYNF